MEKKQHNLTLMLIFFDTLSLFCYKISNVWAIKKQFSLSFEVLKYHLFTVLYKSDTKPQLIQHVRRTQISRCSMQCIHVPNDNKRCK